VATTLELWERFAEAEFPHLRPRTQQLYAQRWRRWQVFIGHAFPAAEATLENLDQYRAALAKGDMAPNQIGEHLKQVKLVYAWAERRELVARNRIALYRFKLGKEERRHEPAEYRIEDFERLVAQMSPQSSRTWRPWALLMVLGHQGVRVRAALHLCWDDVDFAAAWLTWRPAFDKLGREWSQPLRLGTYSTLLTAKWWRDRAVLEGTLVPADSPWVFFSTDARSSTRADGREVPWCLPDPGVLVRAAAGGARGGCAAQGASRGARVSPHGRGRGPRPDGRSQTRHGLHR
jgi:integrase